MLLEVSTYGALVPITCYRAYSLMLRGKMPGRQPVHQLRVSPQSIVRGATLCNVIWSYYSNSYDSPKIISNPCQPPGRADNNLMKGVCMNDNEYCCL